MLNDQEFEQYCSDHALSNDAVEYICTTRTSAPSRAVGRNARGNVCGKFASRKMGHTLQTESRTAEFIFAVECEYSKSVLEFWDQPPPVPISRRDANGRLRSASYTPDYLVLTDSGPELVEVKSRTELQSLVAKDPNWSGTESGYRFDPAIQFFAGIGLTHKVFSPPDSSQTRSSNLRLLMQARMNGTPPTAEFRLQAKKALCERAYMRLSDLGSSLKISDLTHLIWMIDNQELFCLLDEELLSRPDSAWIALSARHLELAAISEEAGRSTPEATTLSVSAAPSNRDAERICRILGELKDGRKGRSMRRYVRAIEDARTSGRSVLEALEDGHVRSGNRKRKVFPAVAEFLDEWILNDYASEKRPTAYASWILYKSKALERHPKYRRVSFPTFLSRIADLPTEQIEAGRGGRRAANAAQSPTSCETRALPPTRSFERGVMDHYQADVFVRILDVNGEILSVRPWVSTLVDSSTMALLALWVSLRAPSRRQVGMLFRTCVRKHGRLPESIIVDRGAEFRSTLLDLLFARYGIHKELRPAEHPKYGSEAERIYGLFKTKWAALRPGNLCCRPEARSASATHAADKCAILTPSLFWEEFSSFSDWHNTFSIGARDRTPINAQNDGLRVFSCSGARADDDYELTVLTSVDTDKYTVDPLRGLHVGPNHYWHPQLATVKRKNQVEVRLDPECPYRVYGLVAGEWITCLSSRDQQFSKRGLSAQREEALWVLDGSSLRTYARELAEQDLVRRVMDADHRVVDLDGSGESSEDPNSVPVDHFSVARTRSIDPVAVREWRD